jgi:hypothetical protein
MKKSMKMSGGKIAIIAVLAILAIIIIALMYDYYRCENSNNGCEPAIWRFWMPKDNSKSNYRTQRRAYRSRYTIRPPIAPSPPIPSTGGTNDFISPYVSRDLKGSGFRMY